MLSIYNSYVITVNKKNGDDRYTDTTTWSGDNGGFGCVCFEWGGTNSILYFNRHAANRMTTVTADTVRTGDYTGHQSGRIYESNPNTWVTAEHGGLLLDLANQFKDYFFNGVTQTYTSLYTWLVNHYGEAIGFSYNVVQNKSPSEMYGAGETLHVDWMIGKATATRLIEFNPPATDEITGENYGVIVIPSAITNWNEAYNYMIAALIFDPNVKPPVDKKYIFDVYIDGTQDPNVAIRWRYESDDDISLQMVTPRIWTEPGIPSVVAIDTHTVDGIVVPNKTMVPTMQEYTYTWPGSYTRPYLSEFGICTQGQSTLDKTILYGIDGIADKMGYLLRFNEQINENNTGRMTWGDLYRVLIPREVNSVSDVSVTRIDNSINDADFLTEVYIHLGVPDDETPDDDSDYPSGEDYDGTDPGPYNPEDPKPDFTGYERTGFTGKAVLTKTYSMNAAKLANVGSKLWSQSYFDVLKIQNNPIENIVGVKWFPFSVSGVSEDIVVGNVNFGIQAGKIDTLYTINVGSVKYTAKKPSSPTFLDMSPYTILKLHCPYVGILQLDASECMNRTINLKYVVDLVSGDCIAYVYLDAGKMPYLTASGHVGVDIPLTASDRIQTEMRAASTAISAVTGAAAHVMSRDYLGAASDVAQGGLSIAGMDYTTQRTSNHSPACATKENGAVFLEIWRPTFTVSEGFKQRRGYPCHKFKTLGTLPGFVKCDVRTRIDFAMTSRENEMLEALLIKGVYITPHDASWTPLPPE